jgi:hypothetical protein
MSADPVIDSSHGTAGLEVVRAITVARRRLRTVAMLRRAAVTVPGGVTAGAALALAGVAPAWTAGAFGLTGAVAAAAWAALRTPTVDAVARQLDARLGLRDRVSAAVQLQPTGGPIAALVARDAAAHLAPVHMATVFPLAIGRTAAVAAAVAVASVAWLMSVDSRAPRTTTPAAASAGGAESSEAGSPVRGPRADARPDARTAEARSRSADARTPEARTADSRGTATREAFAPAPSRGDRPSIDPARESRDTPRSADTGGRDTAAFPASTDAARTGRGGASAGRAGAGIASRGALTSGAGGVAAGNALAANGGGGATAQGIGSYRTARAGAEAALARDAVPPDYRDHVRAYFRALGQEGTR